MPEMGANVLRMGQDLLIGTTVVRRGERLTPQLLALVARLVALVAVYKPLRIAILSTGDELVEPGGELAPGQIFNSNRFALDGLIRGLGMESVDLGIIGDNPKATEQALRQAVKRADLIVSFGQCRRRKTTLSRPLSILVKLIFGSWLLNLGNLWPLVMFLANPSSGCRKSCFNFCDISDCSWYLLAMQGG